MSQATIEKLEKLGFKTAGEKVKRLAEKKRKLAIAYEHYRFVRQEKIAAFNEKLKKKTMKTEKTRWGNKETYQELSFTPVESYAECPPDSVLADLETAIDRHCFDAFEVAHIVTTIKVPDPILFGRINGCTDRFFIAQWDEDVKIQDLLNKDEGYTHDEK